MTRVAILGGGPAGVTAAYELSDPALNGAYEVTLYQSGFRLGGKCASGRNAAHGERIEEHGLHIWFGFYDNAFDLMQRCYAERGRDWRDAFAPCHDVVLLHRREGDAEWHARRWSFPANDGVPGAAQDHSVRDVALRAFGWLRHALDADHDGRLPWGTDIALDALIKLLEAVLRDDDEAGLGLDDVLVAVLRVAPKLRGRLFDAGEAVRQYALAFDVLMAIFRGIVDDDLLRDGFGKINHLELTEWLERHGLEPGTAENAPLLRAFYQLCFAYPAGDRQRPDLAAGKAVQALLRLAFTYEGAVMWKMQGGMGDVVFAPLYEALQARGVRFRFFHHVTGLGLDATGERVKSIQLVRQVEIPGGEYDPFSATVPGCWPGEPNWAQLADGEALRARGVDFERDADPLGAGTVTLTDFDAVVLAIPVGALAPIAGELAARSEPFARMLDHARTVPTQALQVWLDADADGLGWAHGDDTICGAYAEPLDTYCDMSHLIAHERWPDGQQVRHCAYFCGVMTQVDGEDAATALERAKAEGLAHLRDNAGTLWPNFSLARLAGGYDAQYWRANVSPSERYVLTPARSVEHRLRADESGFANLALAGDWTRNGICGGSVEAAVTSGRAAARAISRHPAVVPGLDGWLEAD